MYMSCWNSNITSSQLKHAATYVVAKIKQTKKILISNKLTVHYLKTRLVDFNKLIKIKIKCLGALNLASPLPCTCWWCALLIYCSSLAGSLRDSQRATVSYSQLSCSSFIWDELLFDEQLYFGCLLLPGMVWKGMPSSVKYLFYRTVPKHALDLTLDSYPP